MRALIVCAIVITAAVGLGGCFHHAQAVTQQPLNLDRRIRRVAFSFACNISLQQQCQPRSVLDRGFIGARAPAPCGRALFLKTDRPVARDAF